LAERMIIHSDTADSLSHLRQTFQLETRQNFGLKGLALKMIVNFGKMLNVKCESDKWVEGRQKPKV